MKKTVPYLIIFLIFLTSCGSRNKAHFYVELTDCKKGIPVLLYISDATGAIDLSTPDTIKTGKNGTLSFSIPLTSEQTILLKATFGAFHYNSSPIFITQEGSYNIQLTPTKKTDEIPLLFVEGENSMGIVELNRFLNERTPSYLNRLYDDTPPELLFDTYEQIINKSLLTINQLKNVKRIDDPFYEYAVHQIEYYLAYHTLQFMENRSTKVDTTQQRIINQTKKRIFNRAPVSSPALYQTTVGKPYIDLYLSEIISQNRAAYEESLKKSLGQTFLLNQLKKELHKNVYQYYALEYLWSKTIRLDEESITLWSEYKRVFPENQKLGVYQKMEQEGIPNIKKFYAEGDVVLKPGTIILDDAAPITSFTEAISHFKGKFLFIDIWASWCPDCIKEFEHNEKLKTFLKQHNMECLYISLERSPDRNKWKRYINKYNLAGSHILINDLLKEDLYRVLGTTSLWIPRYILVDPNGMILIPEGSLPSEGNKLYDQITKAKMSL